MGLIQGGEPVDDGKPKDEANKQANKAVNDVADQTKENPADDNAARKGAGSTEEPNPGLRGGQRR